MSPIRRFVVILHWVTMLSTALAHRDSSGSNVTQSPPSLTVAQGGRAKLTCLFSASEPRVKGAVSWYRTAPEETAASQRAVPLSGRFSLTFPRTFLSEGDGSLVISNVSWEDAGIYYCRVLMWEKEEEQGNGTRLVVYTRPSQPEIYLKVTTRAEDGVTLTCRTSGFSPGDVLMSWNSSDPSLPEAGPLQIWRSPRGVSQAHLPLVLPPRFRTRPLEISCIVCHLSLTQPLFTRYAHDSRTTAYQLVEYLNILKLSLLIGLTLSLLLTAIKRFKNR